MTRGNQRENDRLRAQKKQEMTKKKKKCETNFKNSLEQQAEIMRQKQKLHDEKKLMQSINNNNNKN
ncbi:hypothetical protein T552_03298 [Pneumocystis carinii B80]|uniref:Small EDRK-rich factor-like N-terminal domain-containing protein n=1 Tax=Pneumocystis carinii (strain B80) TaxID=1408658 RepID=A0A0W4ZCB9_PNEC8|nr:hypothetical protein T552_03298 [Pneumocystis carinii B80]KTW26029.1 hypothetical protein T552_03298 [Pneumocystis carinii B80]